MGRLVRKYYVISTACNTVHSIRIIIIRTLHYGRLPDSGKRHQYVIHIFDLYIMCVRSIHHVCSICTSCVLIAHNLRLYQRGVGNVIRSIIRIVFMHVCFSLSQATLMRSVRRSAVWCLWALSGSAMPSPLPTCSPTPPPRAGGHGGLR